MKTNGNLIHLCSGKIEQMPKDQPTLKMDKTTANSEWSKMENTSISKNTTIGILNAQKLNFLNIGNIIPKTIGQIYNIIKSKNNQQNIEIDQISEISGVPSWWQSPNWNLFCDEGGGALTWPSCRGDADDPWVNWDGCTAIAGAMVLGYWETHGYPNLPDNDETFIDDCHHFMHTNDQTGGTDWADAAPGLHDAGAYLTGYKFTCTRVQTVTMSEICAQVWAAHPFILSAVFNNGWGAHSVTGRAFSSSNEIGVHNTWNDYTTWIAFGCWSYAEMIECSPN